MSVPLAVEAAGLGKRFDVYPDSFGRVVEKLSFGRATRHREHWALRDVTFEVPRGSALGVMGVNGAGKSTLLKILSGTTTATEGTFAVRGRLGSLLELGAGFHSDFTGRDNVFMNAAIMGVPKREVKERLPELRDFADLGEYFDRPVRTYSSGMAMRLGFAVALLVNPEILILDEVLAVGDQQFQRKCLERIRQIRRSGTTILFVSHSLLHMRQICDRAIWLHGGRVVLAGDPTPVSDEYVNYFFAQDAGKSAQLAAAQGQDALIALPHLADLSVCLAGTDQKRDVFRSGDSVDFHVSFRNPAGEGGPFHLGIIVTRNDDVQVFTTRTLEAGLALSGTGGAAVMRVPLSLAAGEFFVSGFLLDHTCEHVLDQRQAWTRFRVESDRLETGIIVSDARWVAPVEP